MAAAAEPSLAQLGSCAHHAEDVRGASGCDDLLERVDPPAERVSVVIFDHWLRRVFMCPKPEVGSVSEGETEESGRVARRELPGGGGRRCWWRPPLLASCSPRRRPALPSTSMTGLRPSRAGGATSVETPGTPDPRL